MGSQVHYPIPGCVVEFLEDNSIQTALVLEENSGKLRLLLPSRREMKLSANRILPWRGPLLPAGQSREEMIKALEERRINRQKLRDGIDPLAVWEISQGEVPQAETAWFAELFENSPDADMIAAYGQALLACKTHFRFQSPNFQVFDAETVEKRLSEKKAREEKEALVAGGAAFLRNLWELSLKDRVAGPDSFRACSLNEAALDRIRKILHSRMLDPESAEDAALWQMLSHGLPEDPTLPVQLLIAWGKLPPHYDYWLARASYEPGDEWWLPLEGEVRKLAESSASFGAVPAIEDDFISIDSETTRDIDDAFNIKARPDGGWTLTIALAPVALQWQFDSPLDLKIRSRATSIYLPEAVYHMLPEQLGTGAFSLIEGEPRVFFCIRMEISPRGEILESEPFLAQGKITANLNYTDVEKVLSGLDDPASCRACLYAEQLRMAHSMACVREQKRIEDGAIVMRKLEPRLSLQGEGLDTVVDISLPDSADEAQKTVSEMMIAASAALADWAFERQLPLVHRTQDVEVPREYAGIWSEPWLLAKIMRSLVPSLLETGAAPHAALGLRRYAPVTSPLRRYADLINEAQVIYWLEHGKPRWTAEELGAMLAQLSPALDGAVNVQRNRPRYWKLLYFRQQGDEIWWPGVVTEENEHFVTVALPEKGLNVRGRRNLFDERVGPGAAVLLRLGRVHPLRNDIHILEVAPAQDT